MLTIREAKQRLSLHSMTLKRHVGAMWAVVFSEDRHEKDIYFTDDLEDAVIKGGQMRMKRLRAI